MGDVIFEDETIPNSSYNPIKQRGLTNRLIKMGLVRNAKQANSLMIITIVIMTLIMFFLLRPGDSSISRDMVDPETVDQTLVP